MQMSPRPDSNIRISVIEHFGSIFKCWICIYINFRLGLAPSSGDDFFCLKPETVYSILLKYYLQFRPRTRNICEKIIKFMTTIPICTYIT